MGMRNECKSDHRRAFLRDNFECRLFLFKVAFITRNVLEDASHISSKLGDLKGKVNGKEEGIDEKWESSAQIEVMIVVKASKTMRQVGSQQHCLVSLL